MSFLGTTGKLTVTGRGGPEYTIEWRIPRFLSLYGRAGDSYASPCIFSCVGECFLIIFPRGFWPVTFCDTIGLFFERVKDEPPMTSHITIGIKGSGGIQKISERWQDFSKGEERLFWIELCTRTQLEEQKSRLMQGGTLVLVLDLKRKEPSVSRDTFTQTEETKGNEIATREDGPLDKQGVEELQQCLHKLLAGGEDTDVRINVRGKEFPAHRAILRARSPVFQAMFTHDMVERQSGVVTMEDCDPESFPAFLEHIYTGSTEIISIGNVFSLFTAADKYDLSTLKEACSKFIKNNLTVSCMCDVITLAVKHNEKELIECATEFFSSNVSEVLKTVEWQIFLKENTTVGNELLVKAFGRMEKKLSLLNTKE